MDGDGTRRPLGTVAQTDDGAPPDDVQQAVAAQAAGVALEPTGGLTLHGAASPRCCLISRNASSMSQRRW